MPDFDRAKCVQRNRIAARRDAVDAVPLLLLAQAPVAPAGLLYAHGTLPGTPEAALAGINAKLPAGAPALTAADVYIHYAVAANDNFVGDRFMFLHETTLRNIALDAATGVAFMNSHRTGGLSHPSELPFGKTFAGRYEQRQDGSKQALIGLYMRRGTYPAGQDGPSTDDLHALILAGTAADVSVGLHGGQRLCDVCGRDLRIGRYDDYEDEDEDEGAADSGRKARPTPCPHAPGTHRKMTRAEIAAQQARGVRSGHASYSLLDARMHEVSAVYDGAVPGAGFNKTLALAARHQLSRADIIAAQAAYASLLRKGDLSMTSLDEVQDALADAVASGLERVGFGRHRSRAALLADPEPEMAYASGQPGPLVSTLLSAAPDPEKEELRAKLAAAEAREAATQRDTCAKLAKAELDTWVLERKVYPSQNSDRQGTALLAFCLAHATETVRLANGADVTPAEAFRLFVGAQPVHTLTDEQMPVAVLSAGPGAGTESEDMRISREAAEAFADQAPRPGLRVVPPA